MSPLPTSPPYFPWPEAVITGTAAIAALLWTAGPAAPLLAALWPILAGAGVAMLAAMRRGALRDELAHARLLRRETEHRFSNNLQFIGSTLTLAAQREGDDAVRTPLLDAARRVAAMGEVHRLLHRSDEPAPLVIDELAEATLIAAGREDVTLHTRIAATPLPPQTRHMLAMVVTEALTNAVKHAFVGREGGRFDITLEASAPAQMRLALCDNGPGWPKGEPEAQRMGLQIMRGLAHRLDGTLEFQDGPEGGACVTLVFPIAAAPSKA